MRLAPEQRGLILRLRNLMAHAWVDKPAGLSAAVSTAHSVPTECNVAEALVRETRQRLAAR